VDSKTPACVQSEEHIRPAPRILRQRSSAVELHTPSCSPSEMLPTQTYGTDTGFVSGHLDLPGEIPPVWALPVAPHPFTSTRRAVPLHGAGSRLHDFLVHVC